MYSILIENIYKLFVLDKCIYCSVYTQNRICISRLICTYYGNTKNVFPIMLRVLFESVL